MAKALERIDWEKVDARLPTGTDLSAREERLAIFSKMDPLGNKKLSLTELYGGVPPLLDDDEVRGDGEKATTLFPTLKCFKPAIKCSYNVAKKLDRPKRKKRGRTSDTHIDPKEFHSFLISLRQYLEMQVMFQGLDTSKDKMLHYKECEKALPLLAEWNITKAQVRDKFPDEWTPTLEYDDFAEWCIARRFGSMEMELDEDVSDTERERASISCIRDAAEVDPSLALSGKRLSSAEKELNTSKAMEKLTAAFEQWDTDRNGSISKEELSSMLYALNPTFTPEVVAKIFKAADADCDGKIDYKEFCKWALQ